MKKIIFSLVLFFGFLVGANAKTNDTTIEFNNLTNYYYEIKGSNMYLSNYTTMFYANGKIAYCIEPGVNITTHTYDSSSDIASLSKEKKEYLEMLGYFGYEYPGHNTVKYYLATQELIWEYMGGVSARFTSAKNGAGTEFDLSNEKNSILNLIKNYKKNPSFSESVFSIGIENKITDINNVLKDYEVISDFNVKKEGNSLVFKYDKEEDKKIILKYKKYDTNTTLIYSKGSSQKLASLRLSLEKVVKVPIKFVGGNVLIKKTGESLKRGDNYSYEMVARPDIKFGLYDLNGTLINEFVTDTEGLINISGLSFGKYYIKELDSLNYKIDENKYYFEISKDNLNSEITINNYLPKGNVKIIKSDANGKKLSDAIFELYTIDGKLISTFKTKDGVISLDNLAFGKYYLVEVKAPDGYKLDSEKHYFEVSSESELLEINLINDLIIDVPMTGKNDYLLMFLGMLFAFIKRIC